MPAGAAVHIVTGTPLTATFNDGTNTFTIPGVDVTSVFPTNIILTVLGGAPNGGYQIVTSSSFSGGDTTVTVVSYPTGTAYPGPNTFAAGSGTVVVFNEMGTPPPPPTPTVFSQSSFAFPFDQGSWESAGAGYCRPNGNNITQTLGTNTQPSIGGSTMFAIGSVNYFGNDSFIMTFDVAPTFTSIAVTLNAGPTHTYLASGATIDPTFSDDYSMVWTTPGVVDFVDGQNTTFVVT